MVDCSIYQQIEETEDQKLFRKVLERFKTDKNGHIYMDLYIDGKLIEGAELNYGATIDDFINPSTKLYQTVRSLNSMYIDARGASDKASSSSHYNNNLSIYAHMIKCIDDDTLALYEQKFSEVK
jgi:hypothetical protein